MVFDCQSLYVLNSGKEDLVVPAEAYSELCQTSHVERFEKTVNDRKPLTIFAKCFISDV